MDLFSEAEEKESDTPKVTRLTAFYIVIALLPVFFFFHYVGKTDLGLNVFICLGVNVLAVRMRWDLRKHFWFWGVMILVLAFELPVVLMVQWPPRWVPAVELLPIAIAGILIALGAIKFVERFIVKAAPSG